MPFHYKTVLKNSWTIKALHVHHAKKYQPEKRLLVTPLIHSFQAVSHLSYVNTTSIVSSLDYLRYTWMSDINFHPNPNIQ